MCHLSSHLVRYYQHPPFVQEPQVSPQTSWEQKISNDRHTRYPQLVTEQTGLWFQYAKYHFSTSRCEARTWGWGVTCFVTCSSGIRQDGERGSVPHKDNIYLRVSKKKQGMQSAIIIFVICLNVCASVFVPLLWFMMMVSSPIPCCLTSVLKLSSTAGLTFTVRPEEDRRKQNYRYTDWSIHWAKNNTYNNLTLIDSKIITHYKAWLWWFYFLMVSLCSAEASLHTHHSWYQPRRNQHLRRTLQKGKC